MISARSIFREPGYQKFTLESFNAAGKSAGNLQTLMLDGPATADAHFNLKSRRNAASVHLAYPTTGITNIDAFYCEVTATETPLWTYFEACGWHRGYFGMQVNSPTERRIIFSVWDSGNEAVSRSKVGEADRVTLIAKGDGVNAGDFGNEGTGGHSHLVYDWKTGEKQRFLVTAKIADATHTIYSGYWFHPGQKKWMLISSWKAPKDGQYLHGLYSFCENFGGSNGQHSAQSALRQSMVSHRRWSVARADHREIQPRPDRQGGPAGSFHGRRGRTVFPLKRRLCAGLHAIWHTVHAPGRRRGASGGQGILTVAEPQPNAHCQQMK